VFGRFGLQQPGDGKLAERRKVCLLSTKVSESI
jgi:hypothetical protein